jgi:hypothetical protein
MTCAITIWERIEPRPRSNDRAGSLACPIYDPVWFLTRQWQIGEFQGRDAGSLAYVDYFGSSAPLPRFIIKGTTTSVDTHAPLERQTLAEPIEPDLALRVELGQLFAALLAQQVTDPGMLSTLLTAFFATYPLQSVTSTDELSPVDPATQRFQSLCVGRSLDGVPIFQLAQAVVAGTQTIPPSITSDPTLIPKVTAALTTLATEAQQAYGAIGTGDPTAWTSKRLEYQLQVVAVDPGGAGNATLDAVPNEKGEYDWYSFDVAAKNASATETPPTPLPVSLTPSRARFPGMPGPRFWYIEEKTLPYVDVDPDPTDIVKLLVTDMMLVHGSDWFLLPVDQPLGSVVLTKGIIVTDVFGHRWIVEGANQPSQPAGLDRWAMFANTDDSAGQQQLTNYFLVPPSPGSLAQDGMTLEDVRFARDEVADMAWAIERVTESPIGEARSGRERDAEIDAGQKLPPPAPGDPSAVLKYQIEGRVPANWIPLLAVKPDPTDPSIQLEKAAMLHPTSTGLGVVQSLGRFLTPSDQPPPNPYRIVAEEVPRDGLRLTRIVSRSRWLDGTTHLWVSRRRVLGAGEAQSGLRFDSALPNHT